MEIQEDFRELLRLLNKNDVEYMIVGGYALAFHGCPRFTGDIDIYVNPREANARRVMNIVVSLATGCNTPEEIKTFLAKEVHGER